jgi:hypothetical protein
MGMTLFNPPTNWGAVSMALAADLWHVEVAGSGAVNLGQAGNATAYKSDDRYQTIILSTPKAYCTSPRGR